MEDAKDGFVLDCSMTMAWCFDDEATPETNRVRSLLADVRAVVPSLWAIEVANANTVGERRKRLDPARETRFLTLLGTFAVLHDGGSLVKVYGWKLNNNNPGAEAKPEMLDVPVDPGCPIVMQWVTDRILMIRHGAGLSKTKIIRFTDSNTPWKTLFEG